MPSHLKNILIIVVIAFLIILYDSFFTVVQGEQAILLRVGKIITNADGQARILSPGLHLKIPVIETVKWFDMRLQSLNVESSRILTLEQKYVLVDYFAKWRIYNIPLYYTRTGGDPSRARMLLEQKINDNLRAEFGRRNLNDVISDDRETIMKSVQEHTNASAQELGIDVIDVRVKRIDLPTEVSASVFDRMRAERELVATKHRSDGKAAGEKIKADADAKAVVIVATAQANAAKIRGQGEAMAAKVYADAYGQDPDFYAFYRSLQAYQAVFNDQNNVLVLKPDSQFFKYFNSGGNNKS